MNFNIRIGMLLLLFGIVGGLFFVVQKHPEPLPSQNETRDKLRIVTSFYPLYFFASMIVGENGDVSIMTPPGSEPHDYEPTPRDMASIERADLLIVNGRGFEPWTDTIDETRVSRPHVLVMQKELHLDTASDPHFWLSPRIAQQEVERITRALITQDPRHQASYLDNAKRLTDMLIALDTHYREGLRACKKNVILTSHAAFGYLAKEYGFEQVAISGLSPDEEPTPKKLTEIARIAKEHRSPIFVEPLIKPSLANIIAKEAHVEILTLDPLEGLSAQRIKEGATYITEMEKNLANLEYALQCQ